MKRIEIKVSENLFDKINKYITEFDLNRSEFIRQAIEEKIEPKNYKKDSLNYISDPRICERLIKELKKMIDQLNK